MTLLGMWAGGYLIGFGSGILYMVWRLDRRTDD